MQNPDFPALADMVCFALYSANNTMNRLYKPLLDPVGLTYPQYIVLVALWEADDVTVGALCRALGLDTSTVTPLLKRMEAAGLVARRRDRHDERQVRVRLTGKGRALQDDVAHVPNCIFAATGLPKDELADLQQRIAALRGRLARA